MTIQLKKILNRSTGLTSLVCVTMLSACQHVHHNHNKTTSYTLEKAPEIETQQPTQCVDYLKLMKKKPLELTFIGCNASFYDNQHASIANYSVKSKDVLQVQEQLHRMSGMPRLLKDCCAWESLDADTGVNYGVLSFEGTDYKIAMQSSELRLGWNIASDIKRIPTFYVHVVRPLEKIN